MSEETPVVILCIDDDPKALMARRLLLSSAGYDALAAGSGEQALRILLRRDVRLVIADAFLPHITAAEMTAQIKRFNPRILVVLLTAVSELPSGATQADLVLIKGMAPADFLARIAALLAGEASAEASAP